jgi:predicted ATP-grasp superfamily ATP-dependent carboligase
MKILLFEYITGGGFSQQALPDALAKEGLLMLQALLDDFSEIAGIELVLMLDSRLADAVATDNLIIHLIGADQDGPQMFALLAKECDAAWPIAPEFDGILGALCQALVPPCLLLTSPESAVAATGDKFLAYQRLLQYGIATVPTCLLTDAHHQAGEWIVKPIDGVGCGDSHIVSDASDFEMVTGLARAFIIQPHLSGKKTSLSCLFKQGRAWLLCVNLQHFEIIDKQYRLQAITVNENPKWHLYQPIADSVARAFPDLWGYAGIDLIETADAILVLEINPRLTTSVAGIRAATGINLARQVLCLVDAEPKIHGDEGQAVSIKLASM